MCITNFYTPSTQNIDKWIKEQIEKLFANFESTTYNLKGIECWSARELQYILKYAKWENFDTNNKRYTKG